MKSFHEFQHYLEALNLQSQAARAKLSQIVAKLDDDIRKLVDQKDAIGKQLGQLYEKRRTLMLQTGHKWDHKGPLTFQKGDDEYSRKDLSPAMPADRSSGMEPMLPSNKHWGRSHVSNKRRQGLQNAEQIRRAFGNNELMASLYYKLSKAGYYKQVPVPRGISPEQAEQIVNFMNDELPHDEEQGSYSQYEYDPQHNVIITPSDP